MSLVRLKGRPSPSPARRPYSGVPSFIGWSLLGMVLAAGAFLGFYYLAKSGLDALSEGHFEAIETALAAVLVLGVGVAIAMGVRHQMSVADRAVSEADANFANWYVASVDQLGSDQPNTRLGGIYALQYLATDRLSDERALVVDLLSAFVRQASWTRKSPTGTTDPTLLAVSAIGSPPDTYHALPLDLLAALQVLRRIKDTFPDDEVDLRRADFSGMDLTAQQLGGFDLAEANLQAANLTGASLDHADLTGANLANAVMLDTKARGAKLQDADLRDASMINAVLRDANLQNAMLRGANLLNADLQQANLLHANLQSANLLNAGFIGASLLNAKLQGANLGHANLEDANLGRANLEDADLRLATLTNAYWDEATHWPKGFVPEGQPGSRLKGRQVFGEDDVPDPLVEQTITGITARSAEEDAAEVTNPSLKLPAPV